MSQAVAEFITAFQFLTRIQLVTQTQWSEASFGRIVKFFPLIGSMIGLILSGVIYGWQTSAGNVHPHLLVMALILLEIWLTGALHCDGLMDTMDGIFSGRPRERMLEIMKDSRVGAFGAMSFCLLMLCKYSLLMDIAPGSLPMACLAAPIIGRMAIVAAIIFYPYARPDGLGRIFRQYAEGYTMYAAGLFTVCLLAAIGVQALISGVAGMAFAFAFANYVSKRLGGLTGDVYGAICELTQLVVLMVFIF